MAIGCIYKITCMENDNFYIGMTIQNIERRYSEHRRKPNIKIKKDIDKYGWDRFYYEILFDNIPKEELPNLEIDIIEKLKPIYNTSKGGETGPGLDGENSSSAKLTNRQVLEYREKIFNKKITSKQIQKETGLAENTINCMLNGIHYSSVDGPLRSIRENCVGENSIKALFSNKEIKAIRETYYKGGYNQTELGKAIGYKPSNISRILKGDRYSSAGGPILGIDYTTKEIQAKNKKYKAME